MVNSEIMILPQGCFCRMMRRSCPKFLNLMFAIDKRSLELEMDVELQAVPRDRVVLFFLCLFSHSQKNGFSLSLSATDYHRFSYLNFLKSDRIVSNILRCLPLCKVEVLEL
ncbi:hypothetical protein RJT34_28154 [Clitoria ternatea]|uniref:Uncharacterized protein n=1 Tax=Clitoria ternatea TaxID=43366 RepID=A0AAN9FAL8_CLITE